MKTFRMAIVLAIAAGVVAVAGPAQVALVEDVTSAAAGVEFMDYLDSGRIIRLGSEDTIVLSYLGSCIRETITGGTVTVGKNESKVESGRVDRSLVRCSPNSPKGIDGRHPPAGSIMRSIPRTGMGSDSQHVIYGSSPLLELGGVGTLLIERIDQPDERYVFDVKNEQLLRGRIFDFAQSNKALVPGGIYRAVFGTHTKIFRIDEHALPGALPVLTRLLRFVP